MMKLVEKYPHKSLTELPLLFQRILQNTIRDFYRRQKSRSLWVTLFSSFMPDSNEKKPDIRISPNHYRWHRILVIKQSWYCGRTIRAHRTDQQSTGNFTATSTGSLSAALLGRDGCSRDSENHGLLGGKRKDTLFPCRTYTRCSAGK